MPRQVAAVTGAIPPYRRLRARTRIRSRTHVLLTWAVHLPGYGPTGLRASDPAAIQLRTSAAGAIITG